MPPSAPQGQPNVAAPLLKANLNPEEQTLKKYFKTKIEEAQVGFSSEKRVEKMKKKT